MKTPHPSRPLCAGFVPAVPSARKGAQASRLPASALKNHAGQRPAPPSSPRSRHHPFPQFLILSLFLLLGSLLSPLARAEQFGNFVYSSDGSAITIDVYTGEDEVVTIPSIIAELPVRTIGESAFSSNEFVTSLTIPNSVTSIGIAAFYECTNLTSVTIPNSVISIEDFAFSGCGLTSLHIPNSVTSIKWYAFARCPSLTNVTIPASVTSIEPGIFADCGALLSIEVANGNPAYGSVEGVLFNIGQTMLLQYPAGKTGNYAIPTNVTSIGDGAFVGCVNLISMVIPDNIISIGGGAFSYCWNLTSVVIPDSVTSIGESAFWDCRTLASVAIPASVTSIGDDAFGACGALLAIEVAAGNPAYRSVNGVLFNSSQSTLLKYPAGKSGSYTIPPSVITIGPGAFLSCTDLTSVTIPNSVTSIGGDAFFGCRSLTDVAIPSSVTSIEGQTFCYCDGLTSVVIPSSVTFIGFRAFSDCLNLTSVTIPNSVISIEDSAFSFCPSLTSVTIPPSVTSIGNGTFAACDKLLAIEVAVGNPAYRSINGVLFNIGQTALVQYPAGKSGDYTIPASVASIEEMAFSGCKSLGSVTIPASVTFIGFWAFGTCESLTRGIFEGNAPASFDYWAFDETAPGFTIYYYAGRTGFTSPVWNGYPTVMLGAPSVPTLGQWREQHFGAGAANSGNAADNADPDGDGLTNIEEYAAGTDPKSAGSVLQVASATKVGGTYTVAFDALPGRRYELQRLIPSAGAAWQTVGTLAPPAAVGPASLADSNAPAGAALYRIAAVLP